MADDRQKSPAFQFYPKDFLSDEKQLSMSLAEAGAYIRLISACWLEGSLPNEPKLLARLCGATSRQIGEMWPAIGRCFRLTEDGRWIHPRLEAERTKQATFRQRQSDAAASRWHKSGIVSASTPAIPEACSPVSCLPSPSPDSGQERRAHPRTSGLDGTLPRDHLRHAWCSGRGKCVPDFLHQQFMQAVGGDRVATAKQLQEFYDATEAGWPEGPIGDPPVKLWEREFAAKFPSVAPAPGQKPSRHSQFLGTNKGAEIADV